MQSISTIVRKLIRVSEFVQRKFIPYRSNIGSGAFRKIKYFGDISRQLFSVYRDLTIKSKFPKNIFLLFCLFTDVDPTAEKSSKN